ncbi:cell division protein ZapA [Fulvivirga kasyanovii]|uniref:Cell division protein ZapA n=1 Tax=Fulvivirga kasyanovii TaxID=396812 RepID=A0ABW9RRU2_9BACT|nr:cell division protein ZapA [Fulvivirga kasyanovii]MTI26761.1 cell division protein ZapA [Fulvivirga kasyanovii]
MDELSIRIKIADREYPMKVKAEDEARVRSAGRQINERIKSYRERFGIDDKQDLLAMVAFDCLVDKMELDEKQYDTDESVLEKINHLNNIINQAL